MKLVVMKFCLSNEKKLASALVNAALWCGLVISKIKTYKRIIRCFKCSRYFTLPICNVQPSQISHFQPVQDESSKLDKLDELTNPYEPATPESLQSDVASAQTDYDEHDGFDDSLPGARHQSSSETDKRVDSLLKMVETVIVPFAETPPRKRPRREARNVGLWSRPRRKGTTGMDDRDTPSDTNSSSQEESDTPDECETCLDSQVNGDKCCMVNGKQNEKSEIIKKKEVERTKEQPECKKDQSESRKDESESVQDGSEKANYGCESTKDGSDSAENDTDDSGESSDSSVCARCGVPWEGKWIQCDFCEDWFCSFCVPELHYLERKRLSFYCRRGLCQKVKRRHSLIKWSVLSRLFTTKNQHCFLTILYRLYCKFKR